MSYSAQVIASLKEKNPSQNEFHQAVQEVLTSLQPLLDKEKKYENSACYSV